MNDIAANASGQLYAKALAGDFEGVYRIDVPEGDPAAAAFGMADRANEIPHHEAGVFPIASITKGFTATTIGALIDDGLLHWDTPVRSVLGSDLPLIDDDVTVAHLLGHTSGIGDYLDESAVDSTDYAMTVPVHTLDSVEAYLPALDGKAQVRPPGGEFEYNNSGYAVLAIIAERVSGKPFYDLVQEKVFDPADMAQTSFARTDEPISGQVIGYLDGTSPRTNALHLPVRGSGDGGVVTTAGDLAKFWRALLGLKLVGATTLLRLTNPVNVIEDGDAHYGHGFYSTPSGRLVYLEGWDAGISARTWVEPLTGVIGSVLANSSEGAGEILDAIDWE